jgi:hypothetical protein
MKQEQQNFWRLGACTHLLWKIGADNSPSVLELIASKGMLLMVCAYGGAIK